MKNKPFDLFNALASATRPNKSKEVVEAEVKTLLYLHSQGDYSQDRYASEEALIIVKQKENPSA